MRCKIRRIYDPVDPDDGFRVLVDRIWPRGLKKADAAIDLWLKEIAPSTELRKWFNHDPDKWKTFRSRYISELKQKNNLVDRMLAEAGNRQITLLFSARDTEHNQAAVIKEYIEKYYQ